MMIEIQTATIFLSVLSLLISVISLVLTYRQKSHQDKLSARKALTDAVAAIAAANIEFSKLMTKGQNQEVMALRRNLNSQRRYLANHAELLAKEVRTFTTDADYQLIAGAFDAVGDLDRARMHYLNAIESSPTALLEAANIRGFARFLFSLGDTEGARTEFKNALSALKEDNDRNRRERADTLMLWALAERDQGFHEEASRRRDQALAETRRIGSEPVRVAFLEFIDSIWEAKIGKSAINLPSPELSLDRDGSKY